MKKLIFATMLVTVMAFAANVLAVQYDLNVVFGADGTAPIDIDLGDVAWDPTGDPIIKVFHMQPGTTGGTILLREWFHVGGNIPLTDWDEQLMVLDATGQWVVSPDNDNLFWEDGLSGVGNAPWANQPGNWTIDHPNDLAVFDFNPPAVPSTNVLISKEIIVPAGIEHFAVFEWPTVPEPTLGFAGLGMLLLRRRKK